MKDFELEYHNLRYLSVLGLWFGHDAFIAA